MTSLTLSFMSPWSMRTAYWAYAHGWEQYTNFGAGYIRVLGIELSLSWDYS